MSDSICFLNKQITGGEYDYPRYIDLITPHQEEPEETAEEVITRFDGLRRKK